MTPLEITIASLGWLFTGVLLFDRHVLKTRCRRTDIRRIVEKGQFIKRLCERRHPAC